MSVKNEGKFSFKGKVIKGDRKAREIQFSTANVKTPPGIEPGVYAVKVGIKDKIFDGVGYKRKNENIFEVYIFNFKLNIYGEKIKIGLLKKIRKPMDFKTQNDLRRQIEKDCQEAKKVLTKQLTTNN